MHKIITRLQQQDIKVYYMDTDSIITNVPIDSGLVSSIELGKFKLEHQIKEGIFLLPKTVGYQLQNGVIVIKAKGIANPEYSWEWFTSMIENKDIEKKSIRLLYKKEYNSLQIIEKEIQIFLKRTVYDKRTCIYNEKGEWIDSKPLLYSQDIHEK
nr:putative DNA polymerase [Oedogonium sp. 269]